MTTHTVLIVDDDQLSLEIVTDLLREHCNIVTADDGQECLDIARNILPDLILLDIHMLGMTGNEACRQLKGTPRTASIPVIFISSEDHNTQIKLVKAVGANDCMQKPLDADALLDKVSRYLL